MLPNASLEVGVLPVAMRKSSLLLKPPRTAKDRSYLMPLGMYVKRSERRMVELGEVPPAFTEGTLLQV